jgi:hypothetical protein
LIEQHREPRCTQEYRNVPPSDRSNI